MRAANEAELAKLDARLEEAKEQEGETEVREALLAKSDFKVHIGEKDAAITAIEETFGKTVAMGLRLDLLLTKLRVGYARTPSPVEHTSPLSVFAPPPCAHHAP